MTHKKHIIILSITTIIITAIVFTFSSQEGVVSYGFSGAALQWLKKLGFQGTEYEVRKAAHVLMYFVLGASSTALAICIFKLSGILRYLNGIAMGILFSYICAYLDEWNQSHIVGRGGYVSDIRFDAVGFVIGSVLCALLVAGMMRKYRH